MKNKNVQYLNDTGCRIGKFSAISYNRHYVKWTVLAVHLYALKIHQMLL